MTLLGGYNGESRPSGGVYPGKRRMNTNNSLNIPKNLKFFLAMFDVTRRRCLMKKSDLTHLVTPSL
jgi:hypothetical protein